MILLYTAVNVSLAVWLLKGFIDEIPREYEEAAMIDGYTRFQAFVKVVLPQAATGIAATAIFCLIFAWNEYAFAVLLTSGNAQTAPPFIPDHHRRGRPGLAGGGGRHHAVPDPDPRVHGAAAQAPAARHHLRGGAAMSGAICPGAHLLSPCGRRWREAPDEGSYNLWNCIPRPLIRLALRASHLLPQGEKGLRSIHSPLAMSDYTFAGSVP